MKRFVVSANATRGRKKKRVPGDTSGGPVDPPFVVDGIWGTDYAYATSQWTLTNRAGGTIGIGANVHGRFMGCLVESKHTQGLYHPGQGRVWFGVGDAGSYVGSSDIDGYRADFIGSNQPAIYSLNPNSPTTVRQEIGSVPYDSASYDEVAWCPADEGFMVLDEVADRIYVCPLNSHGSPWQVDGPTPTYASATSFTVVGNQTATFPARRRVLVMLNHSVGGADTPKRGRVSSSNFNSGSGLTTVNIAWWSHDSDITMSPTNPPTALKLEDATWQARGGWMIGDGYPYYRQATNKWKKALLRINPTTRATEPVFFDIIDNNVRAASTNANFKNGQLVPAAKSNSGNAEIHCFDRIIGLAFDSHVAWVFDLGTQTITVHSLSGAGSLASDATTQPWPAFDGNRYIYQVNWYAHLLFKWDVLTRTVVWNKPVTYQGEYLFGPCESSADYQGQPIYGDPVLAADGTTLQACTEKDLFWLFWEEELQRLVAFRAAEGQGDVFLIDPDAATLSSASGAVELLANVDQDEAKIRAWDYAHIPRVGSTPPRIMCYGGNSFDTNRNPHPDKLRFLVAVNKRSWETLTNGQHYTRNMTNTSGNSQNAATADSAANPMFLANYGLHPVWGSVIPAVDASTGNPTGTVFIRSGGDGDYTGNEVMMAFLHQISGSTVPLQYNLATDASAAAQWKNRGRMTPKAGGGTTQQTEIMVNPADHNEWQPCAIHGYGRVGYHPSVGYLEDHFGFSLPAVPTNRPETAGPSYTTYSGGSDPTYMSEESQCIWGIPSGSGPTYRLDPAAALSRSLISWSPNGVNAGLWRTRASLPTEGGQEEWHSQCISEYNASNGLTLHCWDSQPMRVYAWDGSAGTVTKIVNVSSSVPGSYILGGHGSHGGQILWLEGNNYLCYSNSHADGLGIHSWTYPNTTATKLTGGAGNALIDAAFSANKGISITVDRVNRRVIWMLPVPSAAGDNVGGMMFWPMRMYQSSFDDLMNLRQMHFRDEDTTPRYFVPDENNAGTNLTVILDGWLYAFRPDTAKNNFSSSGHVGLGIHRVQLY